MSQKFAPSTAVSTIGIDLGKNSFHLVGLDQAQVRAFDRSQIKSRSGASAERLLG
jgi:hypothetical protein